MPIDQIARQRRPSLEAVVESPGDCRSLGDELALADHPGVQRIGDRFGSLLTNGTSLIGLQLDNVALNIIERTKVFQCLFGNLALVVGVQLEELSSCMSSTANFRDAQLESGFIGAVVIAHELAAPFAKERAGMFAGAAVRKVVDHRLLAAV